MKSICVIL
jgi:hypothetical protein